MRGTLAVAVLAVLTAMATPAFADRPNVCLVVENLTGKDVTFTVDGWNQLTWTWRTGDDRAYVSVNAVNIKSPNGVFTVRGAGGTYLNSSNTTFTFREEFTGGPGERGNCNGSWLVTFHT